MKKFYNLRVRTRIFAVSFYFFPNNHAGVKYCLEEFSFFDFMTTYYIFIFCTCEDQKVGL